MKAIFLKANSYSTFDGLFKLEWPSKTGSFFDIESKFGFESIQADYDVDVVGSLYISFGQTKTSHQREVYNLFDLIGDLGGVLEVILAVLGLFILPVSEHSFVMKALSKLYLARTSQTDLFNTKRKRKR